jgi:hypothetical protein
MSESLDLKLSGFLSTEEPRSKQTILNTSKEQAEITDIKSFNILMF